MKNLKKDNKGFSLVELLVVIAIMVVLVGVVAPSLLSNIEKSRESSDIQTIDNIAAVVQTALANEDFYEYAQEGKYANVTINDALFSSTDADKVLLAGFLTDAKVDATYVTKLKSKVAKATGTEIHIKIDNAAESVTVEITKASGVEIPTTDTKSKIAMKVTR